MSTSIKKARIKTGLTQEQAASKIGIHPTTLNKYEGGSRTPSGKVLSLMAQLFGVSMDSLLNTEVGAEQSASNNTETEKEEALYKDKYYELLEKYSTLQEKNTVVTEEILQLNKLFLQKKGGILKKKQG